MLRFSSVRFNKFSVYTALAIAPILLIGSATLGRAQPLIAQSPPPTESEATFTLPSQVAKGTTVKIDGSSSLQTINTALKQRFERQFKGTQVEIKETGSEAALADLLDDQVDLVGMGRALTAEEKAQGLVEVPLSRHKIAIFVGSDNPFSQDLTLEQFGQIFRGEIQDWSELGGAAGAIRFVDRPELSDTRQAFQNYPIFQAAPFQTGANATFIEADQTDAVVEALGDDGIGYAIVDQVKDRSDVRILSMHQVLPTDARYPFSQPLTYVYKGPEPNLAVQAFLGYATATENQLLGDSASESGGAVTGESGGAVTGETAANGVDGTADSTPSATTTDAGKASTGDADVAAGSDGRNAEGLGAPRATGEVHEAWGRADDRRWWPWMLLPLLAAGGLWWLLGRGGQGGGAAIAPVAAGIDKSRLILTPRDCKTAYAYWELSDHDQQYLNESSRRTPSLRLYENRLSNTVAGSSTHLITQVHCPANGQDQHFNIPVDDRDYFVELGVEEDGQWRVLDRSESVRVPACHPSQNAVARAGIATAVPDLKTPTVSRTSTTAAVATGVAGTAGAVAWGNQQARTNREQTVSRGVVQGRTLPADQIILVPRTQADAYVYWEVDPARQQALKESGGQHLKLRIHDVTNIDMDTQMPLSTQEYVCDEHSQDKHVSLPNGDRDYLADLGYETANGKWLRLVRSLSVRPSSQSVSVS